MRSFGMLLAMLAMAGAATASPCGTVYYPQTYGFNYAQNVHHNDYDVKKRVVVLEYQLIPSYPIGLAAPYIAPAAQAVTAPQTPCDIKAAQLEAKIAALEARLGGGSGTGPQPGMPPGALPSTAPERKTPVLNQKCGGCHGKDTAASKGKGLTLLDATGNLLNLDDKTYGAVMRELAAGTMPKDGKLTQDEFTGCLQELVNLHSK